MKITRTKIVRYVARRINQSKHPWIRKGYTTTLRGLRRAVNVLPYAHWGWMGHLISARWIDDTVLELGGFAFERGLEFNGVEPNVRVWLAGKGERVQARLAMSVHAPVANQRVSQSSHDYANSGFRAELDLRPLLHQLDDGAVERSWVVQVEVSAGGVVRHGPFRSRFGSGSAGHIPARMYGDVQVIPRWVPGRGLVVTVGRPAALVTSAEVRDRDVRLEVSLRGISVAHASLVSGSARRPLQIVADGTGTVSLATRLPLPPASAMDDKLGSEGLRTPVTLDDPQGFNPERGGPRVPLSWHQLVIRDTAGGEHVAVSSLDLTPAHPDPDATIFSFGGPEGRFGLCDTAKTLIIEAVQVHEGPEPFLVVSGSAVGDVTGSSLRLIGGRQVLPADHVEISAGRFEARVPLLASEWSQQALPPRSGSYILRAQTREGDWFRVTVSQEVVSSAPTMYRLEGFKLRLGVAEGFRLKCTFSPPLRDDELGSYNRRRLEAEYRSRTYKPERAVYFESFYGRISTCNPRALDAEIARTHPDWVRYWGVVDNSVAVPPGAIAVVEGTQEWWDARGRATYVIINDWARNAFKHQPHQVVLQTWHGSMLKKIGLDRPTTTAVSRRALLRERDRWDLLLSQNPHSTEIFASAYQWDRPILEEGYPRNDALAVSDGAPVRERLGIRADQVAVLYAPTWRDNVTGLVTYLDVAQLSEDLGEGYVILLRGHSRTMGHGASVTGRGVIDVTTYPDITELFLAADILITDFSSVMFDYSATGKPMIFFVPDMDDYRDVVRGVYFDLSAAAPGPVLYTQEQVTGAIRAADRDAEQYAEQYKAWQARFNLHDDGHASERVVERLFATRPSTSSNLQG